ncbi:hypothetical protein CTAYLR_007192 [Chrysophaeum taylorii]|uniref:Uncharacterized protein n=1 Tax=Chrysophaeum taylorii TaxID=2483200 RepID=A0AAD7UMU4_9STRA|nr:hypothetical protein CTAYLR_007192 [Chrysophaeum taylorii]
MTSNPVGIVKPIMPLEEPKERNDEVASVVSSMFPPSLHTNKSLSSSSSKKLHFFVGCPELSQKALVVIDERHTIRQVGRKAARMFRREDAAASVSLWQEFGGRTELALLDDDDTIGDVMAAVGGLDADECRFVVAFGSHIDDDNDDELPSPPNPSVAAPAACPAGPATRQGHVKRRWTAWEDDQLRRAVVSGGPVRWSTIAQNLGTRDAKQCRDRWQYQLNPQIKKGRWTPDEDARIMSLPQGQWAKVVHAFPGRTDMAIKNRYHALIRRKRRAADMASSGGSNKGDDDDEDEDDDDEDGSPLCA